MLRVTSRAARSDPAQACLRLSYEGRQKRRQRARLDDGREIALLLERGGPQLRAGDRLRAEDGSIIEIAAQAESISLAQTDDPLLLARACYHLGNRHVPLAVEPGCVRYPHDHVLDDLARQLGLRVTQALEPFEPEGGAYAHAASHTHGGDPVHTHGGAAQPEHGHEHEPGAHAKPEPASELPHAHTETDPLVDLHTTHPGTGSRPSGTVAALLPLLRLASPALPIGAFAYSQGLEAAVESGWIRDEASARDWIVERLGHALARTDLPVFLRLHAAWSRAPQDALRAFSEALRWSAFLLACRESRELQQEDRQLGAALARLLAALGDAQAKDLEASGSASLAAAFALAAARSGCDAQSAAAAYAWAWLESQVAAAQRSLPLGQTGAQRIVLAGAAQIPAAIAEALRAQDDEIGAATPGVAIASAHHEQQYTRLFRS